MMWLILEQLCCACLPNAQVYNSQLSIDAYKGHMNRFIDFRELKVLIFIPLLVYFFYAIAEVFFWIAAFDFMYTNNFTDAEMDEAIISSPLVIGVLLFILGFFNMLTAYLVAGYLKGNFVKSAVLIIIVVEVID
ncbi:hypothetical protein CWB99_20315 [Pseudoalteromonas rubra]|uniref:Uncharacterized protein n=2 Tax=Pseudoalteromonas rubra TaxID=43658 RepID=A0A5S3WGI4_9GAMM|nr:hypothetical protein CWB99_20315 [Pseudoalteromonas rubra]TMP29784.1 hypothetical protein CWC00_18155 [Pseudoalteromonas rubra]